MTSRTLSDNESLPRSFGKALALLFLPPLAAFLLQSNHLLRIYVALLGAKNPDPLEPEPIPNNTPQSSWFNWRIISAIFVLLILSVAQLYNVLQSISPESVQQAFDDFTRYIIYACLVVSVATITLQISNPGKLVVHRTSNGQYVTSKHGGLLGDQKPPLVALLVGSIAVFAFLVVAGLSGPNNSFSIAVVTTAYIAAMSSIWVLSLPPLVIMYSLFMVLILALSLFINRFDPSSYTVKEESVWATNILSKNLRFVSFLPAALYEAWFIGPLIACVLRFDFAATLSKQNPIYLEGAAPSSPFDSTTNQRLGKGVVVPRSVPRTFRKPYYTVALATWSLIHLATIVLCLTTSFPLKSIYDSSCLGALFEFPIITIVLLLFAKMRGEAKTLWNYTEVWFVKPLNVKGELLPIAGDKTGPQPEHATA